LFLCITERVMLRKRLYESAPRSTILVCLLKSDPP
jgi:hypothetical protein